MASPDGAHHLRPVDENYIEDGAGQNQTASSQNTGGPRRRDVVLTLLAGLAGLGLAEATGGLPPGLSFLRTPVAPPEPTPAPSPTPTEPPRQVAPLVIGTIAAPPTIRPTASATPRSEVSKPATHEGFEELIRATGGQFETWADKVTRLGTHISMYDYKEKGILAKVREPEGVKIRYLPDETSDSPEIQPWLKYGQEFTARFELEVIKSGTYDTTWLSTYQPRRSWYKADDPNASIILAGFSQASDNRNTYIQRETNREVLPVGQFPRFYLWNS